MNTWLTLSFFLVLFIVVLMLAVGRRRFQRRVALALQNLQQASQHEIETYFQSRKWRVPNNMGHRLAVMITKNLLSLHNSKHGLIFRLEMLGKALLPKEKPKKPTETPTFPAGQYTKK